MHLIIDNYCETLNTLPMFFHIGHNCISMILLYFVLFFGVVYLTGLPTLWTLTLMEWQWEGRSTSWAPILCLFESCTNGDFLFVICLIVGWVVHPLQVSLMVIFVMWPTLLVLDLFISRWRYCNDDILSQKGHYSVKW